MSTSNKPYTQAIQDLRRSNAARPHGPKHRKGTRNQRERDAIRDQLRDLNQQSNHHSEVIHAH